MAVRWDAVVESGRYWSEPLHRAPEAPALEAGRLVSVRVFLFGSLADAERFPMLQLRSPFCVGDVISELGRRYGSEFLARVIASGGGKLRHCRIFLNGEPADDMTATVHPGEAPAQVEIILLTAAEGG